MLPDNPKVTPRETPQKPNAAARVAGIATEAANEYFSAIHRSSSRDVAADGGDPPCRVRSIPAVARVRASGSRLPDDSSRIVLSRRKPGRDVLIRDGAPRTAVRPGSRPQTNDVDELV